MKIIIGLIAKLKFNKSILKKLLKHDLFLWYSFVP